MSFADENDIANAKVVIDQFGYWPSFHDSEVLSIKFERAWDKSNSTMQLKVYAFEMTDKLKGRYFELIKPCIIDFEFVDINKSEIDGFNHQNAVQGLEFGREGDYLFCRIDSAYGLDGYIEAKEIKVIKLDPREK